MILFGLSSCIGLKPIFENYGYTLISSNPGLTQLGTGKNKSSDELIIRIDGAKDYLIYSNPKTGAIRRLSREQNLFKSSYGDIAIEFN